MHNKQRLWYVGTLLFIIFSIALGAWGWNRFRAQQSLPVPVHIATPAVVNTVQPVATPSLDMTNAHLVIPAINLNAPVESVGVSNTGNMEVPQKDPWVNVGWYQKGPLPGMTGSSVIDGHLDRPGGSPAVFWNLDKLHVGDTVTVADAKGHTQHFRVTKMADYAPDNAPLTDIFGNRNGAFLNLITCAGSWIPTQHQTTLRLVVYTTRI